ncbi:hypothetical protein [Streptomyces sp. NPDC001781]
MTQPPRGRAAFAPQAGPAIPAQRGPSGLPPVRRTAFVEGAERLRDAATTEPGRLRVIGAVLALLVVAFGAVTAWQSGERASAADDVLTRSQPLSSGAAAIYRSLADANTAASTGFLAGPRESAANRERYEDDIRTAASGLVRAAAETEPGSPSEATVRKLNRLLPEYKGLVERARVYNRQGYPVGGAYLRYANEKMQADMLPAARDLYTKENQRLDADYADATPYPWAALGLGLLALAALGLAQYRDFRRTNRVLNHGLVAASAATVVVLLWLVVGHTVARSELLGSYTDGVRSLNVLNNARIAALNARGNENLSLVARGAETVEVNGRKQDRYYSAFDEEIGTLDARLAEARRNADDAAGGDPVDTALDDTQRWKDRHDTAQREDEKGNYARALDLVIGVDDTTGAAFDGVDRSLTRALGHEQSEFDRDAADGRDAMTGLPVGAAVLGVLGAAGALYGIGRRLSEYR